MKNNSHNDKPSFGLLFALIALLAIGIAFGKEMLLGILMWIAIFAVAMLVLGVVIILTCTIKEEIAKRKNKKEEETHPN